MEILLAGVLAFAICLLITPFLIKLLRRLKAIDSGGGRKIHKGAVPTMGGLGIFVAVMATMLIFCTSIDFHVNVHYIVGAISLMFLLGFILIMGGVQQIASLSMARRWMPVPGAFYLVPSLILIAGIIALFNPTGARNTAFIIIGVSSLVYSLTELINWFKFTRRRPKTPVVHDDDDIEDAKIIE